MVNEKKHIAVLTTEYLNIPSANGICAKNLVTELKKVGNEVDVICFETNGSSMQKTGDIHTVRMNRASSGGAYSYIFHKLKIATGLICGHALMLMSNELIEKYKQKLDEIHSASPIDIIVAMFFTTESVEAMVRFKVEHPSVQTVSYELDSIGDGIAQSAFKRHLEISAYNKWLREKYKTTDRVIVMKTHEDYWKQQFGEFASKMYVADIPVLISHDGVPELYKKCTMVYTGLLDKEYRSPTYLLTVLRLLSNCMDFEFLFFSKGNCEDEIAAATAECPVIKQKGFVSQEEMQKVVDCSHFLISIGNSISRSVPSKLISYIASGKPVIHFSSQENDVCQEYLDNYPLGLIVKQSMPCDQAAEAIYQFAKQNCGKYVDFNSIKEKFYLNDPAYGARLVTAAGSTADSEYEG